MPEGAAPWSADDVAAPPPAEAMEAPWLEPVTVEEVLVEDMAAPCACTAAPSETLPLKSMPTSTLAPFFTAVPRQTPSLPLARPVTDW